LGDEILKEISILLINSFRKIDIVGRWGGEEFIVILPFTTKEEAINLAENLRLSVLNHKFSLKTNNPITISLGVGELSNNRTIENTLCKADEALYLAKNSGRNRVEISK